MVNENKSGKDRGSEDRHAAPRTDKKSGRTAGDDSGGDEVKLKPVKPKVGEPADNLRRRAEWFQKRHGGG
jgi:hypothetical protein